MKNDLYSRIFDTIKKGTRKWWCGQDRNANFFLYEIDCFMIFMLMMTMLKGIEEEED